MSSVMRSRYYMKKGLKKAVKWILGIGLLMTMVHYVLTIRFGNINYSDSISTHDHSNDQNEVIITTSWAKLITDKKWLHISYHPTCPAHIGSLISFDGVLNYEYGIFVPSYDSLSPPGPESYQTEMDTVNQVVYRKITSKTEFGVFVPQQNNMKWDLLIYPSSTGHKNKEELLKMIQTATYH